MKQRTAILLVLLLLLGSAVPASANSAQSYWEGVDRAGAIITDGESPIVVEHEKLTFDVQEFPQNFYSDEEDFLAYTGKVTAQYTFYNPSQLTVTAKLLFHFGREAWYAYDCGGQEDTQKYDILINGEPTPKKIRYTLSDNGQFTLEQDLKLICDGFADDPFYSPDLTVTAYKFSVSGVDVQNYKSATVGFDVPKGLGDHRFYLPESRGSQRQDNGDMRVIIPADESFYIYVFGEPLTVTPQFRFYQNGAARDSERISGTASFIGSETLTLKEFVLQDWREETGVSETDWYNAKIAVLHRGQRSAEYPVVFRETYGDFRQNLMRWYEYEITVEPGGRIVNSVTAPIYPSINLDYNPPVYGYTYLLSPAKTWRSFGTLEIEVNTPYYITESSLDGFEKTDTGYKLTLDGLPDGELTFTLSTSENPEKPKSNPFVGFLYILAFIFSYIGYLFESLFAGIAGLF